MDDLRPDDLQTVAARVVAWHNRHPLARRIRADQVQSVGYVALPYLVPAGTDAPAPARPAAAASPEPGLSLRERAQVRSRQGEAEGDAAGGKKGQRAGKDDDAAVVVGKPAFSEDFIAPLKPKEVGRWAARHGLADAKPERGVPLRHVESDPALAPSRTPLLTLYALTAMVEIKGERIRLLLSLKGPSVLGTRMWSRPRLGAAAGLGSALAAAAVLGWWMWPARPPQQPLSARVRPVQQESALPVIVSPASAAFPSIRPSSMREAAVAALNPPAPSPVASAVAGGAHGSAGPQPVGAAKGKPDAAEGTLEAALPAGPGASAVVRASPAAPVRPVDVEPTLGRISLPALGLPHGDEAHATDRDRRRFAAGRLPAEPGPASPSPPEPAAAPATAPAPAAAPVRVAPLPLTPAQPAPAVAAQVAAPLPSVFALSTRRLRTRAESEQVMVAVKSLLATAGHAGVHVEVLPTGEDWRVVGWPFPRREQAEKARTLLAARGMRLEVVDF